LAVGDDHLDPSCIAGGGTLQILRRRHHRIEKCRLGFRRLDLHETGNGLRNLARALADELGSWADGKDRNGVFGPYDFLEKLGGRLLLELEAWTRAARDIEQQREVYGRFPRFS